MRHVQRGIVGIKIPRFSAGQRIIVSDMASAYHGEVGTVVGSEWWDTWNPPEWIYRVVIDCYADEEGWMPESCIEACGRRA